MSVLRERNFRYLFAARTISFFGTNLAPIAVAFAVLGLGGSATEVGLAFAAWTLAQISTLLVGGVVADRLPRRLVMIGSDTANLCVRVAMGGLLLSGHARIWELIALQAVGGAAVAFYSPASTGLVPETVPQRLLQQANSFMSIARYAAFPLGAAVGGTLVATVGAGYALLLDGATYGTSALLLSMMRLPGRARTAAATNFIRELREGWQAFTEHTWVWLLTFWISPTSSSPTPRSSCSGRTSPSSRSAARRPGRSSSPGRRSARSREASSGCATARGGRWSSSGRSSPSPLSSVFCSHFGLPRSRSALPRCSPASRSRSGPSSGTPRSRSGSRATSCPASAPTTGWAR